jgi:hypothetical protein
MASCTNPKVDAVCEEEDVAHVAAAPNLAKNKPKRLANRLLLW